MSVLLHLGMSPTSGSLGVECFQPPLDISSELCVFSSSFSSPGSKFLGEHVTSQLRFLILVAPCWMKVPWLSTDPNMLAHFPHQFHIISDFIIDVSVSQVLEGVQ